MDPQDYLPLISTVIGGLLAVVGGFVANFLLHDLADRRARRAFLREQLEQCFLLSDQFVAFVRARYRVVLQTEEGQTSTPDAGENPLARLQMIVAFYHPDLDEHMARLEKYFEAFQAGVHAYYLHQVRERADAPGIELIREEIDPPYRALQAAQRDFVEALKRQVDDYM